MLCFSNLACTCLNWLSQACRALSVNPFGTQGEWGLLSCLALIGRKVKSVVWPSFGAVFWSKAATLLGFFSIFLFFFLSRCFPPSTETVRLFRDGEPRTTTSTFTQLLNSDCWGAWLLDFHAPSALLGCLRRNCWN